MPNYDEPGAPSDSLGANIFRTRRKLHLTQKQLASPEFSISYISAIERGRIRPSLRALDILARRLGVTPAELLATRPDTPRPEAPQSLEGEIDEAPSLIALLKQRHPSAQASLMLSWVGISISQHNLQLAKELLEQLPPNAISAEQRLLRLYYQGTIALTEGHPAEAQALFEQTLKEGEFSSHVELQGRCRFSLAVAYEAQEKFLLAADTFAACVEAIEKGIDTDPLFIIQVYSGIAEHYRHRERRDLAAHYFRQVLNQFTFLFNPAALAEASARISYQHLKNVHPTLAEWHGALSRVLYRLDLARHRFTQAAWNLGLTLKELGDSEAAEQQLRQTIDFCEQLGTPRQAVLTRIALADLLLERHAAQEAERLALEAQALCRPGEQEAVADEPLYGRILVTLGDANFALGRLDEAERCFQQAIELLKNHDANEHLSHAYFRYSALLHEKGQDAESYQMMTQAYLLNQRKP
jgi:tetratricopeptide (TPR) repeat protein/DNA-binding XRE family transcriptional regulator